MKPLHYKDFKDGKFYICYETIDTGKRVVIGETFKDGKHLYMKNILIFPKNPTEKIRWILYDDNTYGSPTLQNVFELTKEEMYKHFLMEII